MAKKAFFYLTVSILATLLAGCSPREAKVDGSIFIVTQGSENFKLGLVTISIFDQQQIEPYLTKTTADLEKTLKELKEQRKSLSEKHDKAISARDALNQQFERAKDQADKTLQMIGGNAYTRPKFSDSDANLLESSRKTVSQVSEYRQKQEKLLNDAAKLSADEWEVERKAVAALRDKLKDDFWASQEIEKLERKKQEIAEAQTNWDSFRLVYLRQVETRDRLSKEWQKPNDEANTTTKSLAPISERLQNWLTEQPQVYFNSQLTPVAVAKSDADGKFSLKLPKKGKFIFAAQAQRRVSNRTENYFWLIQVHPDGKSAMQVMLSNDNLITENSSEGAVRFPMP